MSTNTEEGLRIKMMAAANISLAFNITNSSTTTVSVGDIEAGYIAANANTPNGNNPSANGNAWFVWTGGAGVNFLSAPVATGAPGQPVYGNFDAETYVLAYSVGPSVTTGGTSPVTTYPNIAATAYIPANWSTPAITYFSPSLGINSVQTGMISFNYNLPQNINPKTNGAWIGLWTGTVIPYDATGGNAAPIMAGTAQGSAPMMGLTTITPGGTYTAALFTSGYSTNPANLVTTAVATVITFTTTASPS